MAGSPGKNSMSQLSELFSNQLHVIEHSQTPKYLKAWQNQNKLRVYQSGIPKKTDEDWKYTPLSQLHDTDLMQPLRANSSANQINCVKLPVDAYIAVFIDGVLDVSLSDDNFGPWQYDLLDEQGLKKDNSINDEVFLRLTQAYARQPTKFSIAANIITDKPLYLLHINTCYRGGMQHYYHQIDIGESAKASVLEQHVAINSALQYKDLYGSRMVINVRDNATLKHYNFITQHDQTQHFSHNDIHIGRNNSVESYSFLLSGGLIRHHTSSHLNDEGSHVTINSLSLPAAEQVYDSRTFLRHKAANCTSEQLHKNIVQDNASAVFNGMIEVSSDAIKTNGQMDNHNLLLSEKAQVNSKPQLEIYADDVKCSHGSTTGALNKEQLFYLMARGISKKQALRTLVFAFAAEVFETIEGDELKASLASMIETKLECS